MEKVCSKCKLSLPLTLYSFRDNKYRNKCINCEKKYYSQYYKNNKNKIAIKDKKYAKSNSEKIKKYQEHYRLKNKEAKKKYNSTYRLNNKEAINAGKRKHYNQNKEKINKQKREYIKSKSNSNLLFKLSTRIRTRLYVALKNNFKSGSAVKDLGCSVEDLKVYLESKFYSNPETHEEMSWDNWNRHGWHIDHIKPLSTFDLTDRTQFLKACNYTNLQPLWAKENLSKSNKINE